MSESFTAAQITDLLTELGADLDSQGIRAELFIVGGAAMALAYNTRRATRDIDAVFEPKTEIYEAAARLAARRDLPEDWLNDAIKGFLPGEDPNRRFVFSAAGINVSVPSPQYLLALKVHAARVDRDADDIKELARICGATSADEVLAITDQIMGVGGSFSRRPSSWFRNCSRPTDLARRFAKRSAGSPRRSHRRPGRGW